jgi:hypothetical protein
MLLTTTTHSACCQAKITAGQTRLQHPQEDSGQTVCALQNLSTGVLAQQQAYVVAPAVCTGGKVIPVKFAACKNLAQTTPPPQLSISTNTKQKRLILHLQTANPHTLVWNMADVKQTKLLPQPTYTEPKDIPYTRPFNTKACLC